MVRKMSLRTFINRVNKKIRSGDLSKSKALNILRAKRAAVMRKKCKASKDEALLLKELKKMQKRRKK